MLLPAKTGGAAKKLTRPKPEAHELAEIWRCAASLERLDARLKETLGDLLVKDLSRPEPPGLRTLWCLGRLGARVPLYGPANTVVPPEKAAKWVRAVLGRESATPRESTDTVFALSQLARVSGDRARDLDDALRAEVITRLASLGVDESVLLPVREFHELEVSQQGQALGDALPTGLRLVRPGTWSKGELAGVSRPRLPGLSGECPLGGLRCREFRGMEPSMIARTRRGIGRTWTACRTFTRSRSTRSAS